VNVSNYVINISDFTDRNITTAYSALPDIKKQAADRISLPKKRAESILAAYLAFFALLKGKTSQNLVYPCKGSLLDSAKEISRLGSNIGWPTGEYGKPFPEGVVVNGEIRFIGISHSKDYAVAAVSKRQIGVDVQVVPEMPANRIMRIAERFHPDELAWLNSVEQKKLAEQFCRLWACKESVIKLCGKGMKLPLSSFSVLDGCLPDNKPVSISVYALEKAFLANAAFTECRQLFIDKR
jgi:phosphopantetheinyl transferase (holo-ACP synthase)